VVEAVFFREVGVFVGGRRPVPVEGYLVGGVDQSTRGSRVRRWPSWSEPERGWSWTSTSLIERSVGAVSWWARHGWSRGWRGSLGGADGGVGVPRGWRRNPSRWPPWVRQNVLFSALCTRDQRLQM